MIIIIILVVFVILAKRYKLRVRENEVNIHMIAEEHYVRYIEQDLEYQKHNMILQIDLCVYKCQAFLITV